MNGQIYENVVQITVLCAIGLAYGSCLYGLAIGQ